MKVEKDISYRIDGSNQLQVKIPGVKKYQPLRGEFATDDKNRLVYLVREPSSWRRKYNIPNRIVLQGRWRLDSEHNLVLELEKVEKKKRSLKLKGTILAVGDEWLMFRIKSKPEEKVKRISYLKLRGSWRSDRFNRIIFEVEKKEVPQRLVFRNAWTLNENNQIVYTYKKRRENLLHSLLFRGSWQISEKNTLSYILKKERSQFDFRAYLQTPTLYPAKGKIKYRIGIGLKKRRKQRVIIFSGEWKFSRKLGVFFELERGGGKREKLYFSSRLNLTARDRLIFALSSRRGRPLGMKVAFRRSELRGEDWEYFLRLRKRFKDTRVELGARFSN